VRIDPASYEPGTPYTLNALKDYGEATTKRKVEEIAYIVKSPYCQCPDYNQIIPTIIKNGVEKLPEKIQMTTGIPIKPMLAQLTKGVSEVLERFDGIEFPGQIHFLDNGKIIIYSCNQGNNTSKYPDIINRFDSTTGDGVTSCILDCEAVAWDREKKQILLFQILSTRKRNDANEADIKVQVCL
jgi:DNA ligase-1